MACEAKSRRRYSDPGWECDGTDLIYLMDGPKFGEQHPIPVVAPASALDEFLAEPWADVYHPRPFAGGDHLHACLPSRKPAESQR